MCKQVKGTLICKRHKVNFNKRYYSLSQGDCVLTKSTRDNVSRQHLIVNKDRPSTITEQSNTMNAMFQGRVRANYKDRLNNWEYVYVSMKKNALR